METFRKPVSRRELINEVRECLDIASGRLAEAEAVHIQLVNTTEQLLKTLENGYDPTSAIAAVREVLQQERDKR